MQELNQGEDYEEEEDYGFEEDPDYDESEEDTDADIDMIFGIPKNKFIIGVIVAVLVILVIVVFATRKKKEDDGDQIVMPPAVTNDAYTEDTATADTTYVEDTTTSASTYEFYDASGNYIGTAEGIDEGWSITDANGNYVGDTSLSGTEVYDASGNFLAYYNPANSEPEADADTMFEGSDQETLRKLGYTGDEIQLALDNGVSTEALIEKAQSLRDAEAKEALIRMSDSASEEFQTITNNSIFCMEPLTFPVESYDELTISETHSYVVNSDYVKMPTYGPQLYIKCKIANGNYVFYNVTPTRWVSLPETGNIVLNVEYQLYGNDSLVNFYIVGVNEVNTTELTVNPEDSGVSLQDVVNDLYN